MGRKKTDGLTETEERVLGEIKKFVLENNCIPSIRELLPLCGLSENSIDGMRNHIKNLQSKGFLTSTGANKSRNLQIPGWSYRPDNPAELVTIPVQTQQFNGDGFVVSIVGEKVVFTLVIDQRIESGIRDLSEILGICDSLKITGTTEEKLCRLAERQVSKMRKAAQLA